mmetsp:Transcript_3521/g.14610  ORF Transcript_3521/g.14610 Transcript_3521/m.14610 type:complete len:202 (-) Transcript_3521:5241-5846(-)
MHSALLRNSHRQTDRQADRQTQAGPKPRLPCDDSRGGDGLAGGHRRRVRMHPLPLAEAEHLHPGGGAESELVVEGAELVKADGLGRLGQLPHAHGAQEGTRCDLASLHHGQARQAGGRVTRHARRSGKDADEEVGEHGGQLVQRQVAVHERRGGEEGAAHLVRLGAGAAYGQANGARRSVQAVLHGQGALVLLCGAGLQEL